MTDVALHERREVAIRALIDLGQKTGFVEPAFRRAVAESIGLSDRQVRRDISAGGRVIARRRRQELKDEYREGLWDCRGNVSELARRLAAQHGAAGPARRTLARIIEREISRATMANIKHGESARHEFEVSLPQECEDIGELYGMDGKQLSILARDGIEIWVLNVVDCCSRVIVNFVIFCCVRLTVMLARKGRPSGEKNSRFSSSDSISPSNWNDPQMKRTAGGTNLPPSSLGVMK